MPSYELILPLLCAAVVSYLLGSISFSIIFTRVFKRTDIREHGSGNAGTTNVLRTAGKLPAALTFLCDFLKCVAAICVSRLIFEAFHVTTPDGGNFIGFAAGIFCLLGHIRPLYFGFRGGKGVVTTAALMFMINWKCFLIGISIFIVLLLITRYVSLSALVAALSTPISIFVMMHKGKSGYIWLDTAMASIFVVILFIMHRSNIRRLCNGTESKIWGAKSTGK